MARVVLVQHGQARPEDEDPDRPLTDGGRRDVTRVAARLAAMGVAVEEIHHSGKTRARQTAEILGAALRPASGVVESPGLAPKDDARAWTSRLQGETRDVLIAGHLPSLSRLASALLVGHSAADLVAFRQGGAVALERDAEGRWRIAWAIPPEAAG